MPIPLMERSPNPVHSLLFKINANDLLCAIITVLLWAGLSFITPSTMYIPINDPQSSFPYKTDLIPSYILDILIFPVAWLFLLIFYVISKTSKNKFRTIHFWTVLWLHIISVSTTNISTTVLNIWVGRVKPDYFARCGPNVHPDQCDILNKKQIAEEKKSFPSSDAAAMMASMTFLSFMLMKMCRQRPSWVTCICLLFIIFALWAGSIQISDHKSHPDDVIAGFVCGFSVCAFIWNSSYKRIFRQICEEPSDAPSD
ncbi:PAP2 superfamily protein [Tritrichomonas foetus]|uniref:PAP2 superfamily protein n=1 Tax=Tritrichomonas foetus TaxID=1144522 RepID=A0A1J4JGX9_9EUKA|nr:PAP2 superfamily protein [Tritrichomonas foetus]|eukprot:OHS98424.1 PAP2 superfamily protein [Tritrichomonas foetus]